MGLAGDDICNLVHNTVQLKEIIKRTKENNFEHTFNIYEDGSVSEICVGDECGVKVSMIDASKIPFIAVHTHSQLSRTMIDRFKQVEDRQMKRHLDAVKNDTEDYDTGPPVVTTKHLEYILDHGLSSLHNENWSFPHGDDIEYAKDNKFKFVCVATQHSLTCLPVNYGTIETMRRYDTNMMPDFNIKNGQDIERSINAKKRIVKHFKGCRLEF